MRKSQEEITREVFGQGSRWIGWNHWLTHQLVFKYIWNKVEQGTILGSRASFYLRTRTESNWATKDMIKVNIDNQTGDLSSVEIPGGDGKSRLTVMANCSVWLDSDGVSVTLSEMFEDPWRPTFEELDLFQVLYGDEQILIDINREFFGITRKFDKAVGNMTISTFYPK
jgi:hypothetical protein